MADKVPMHKHAHPVYGWIALVISVFAILGVAGWWYLTYAQGLNDDLVYSVREMAIGPKKETTSVATGVPTNVKSETSGIDKDVSSVADSDFSDTQLDNTILGIQ